MGLLKFLIRRSALALLTFLVISLVLYGIMMLAPAEARGMMYMPRVMSGRGNSTSFLEQVIEEHGLDDPFLVQYGRWLFNLVRGDWGWSPSMREDVLAAFIRRTPVTAELTLYSILLYIPLGIVGGVIAGWKRDRAPDLGFRFVAFISTSIPPFILGLVLLTVFYAGLNWFPAGRISMSLRLDVNSASFRTITGLLTIDGLLNGRPDITIDAIRHLIMPVFALSLTHWATLGRVTRAAIIEELDKEYVTAARGRGLSMRLAVWRHALRNAMVPALNSSALSAAMLITGVFVIEAIFSLPGVSEPISTASAYATYFTPDMPATMGFALYGMMLVLPVMLILDILQAIIDPRIREGVLS